MNFAREGLLFIAIAAVVAAGAFGFALSRRSWGLWLAAFVLLLLALWVAYFFRDPERVGERGRSLVVAPADGKLIMITEVDEPAFMQGRAIRLSIFMNVFNVHVNRYPVDGVVTYIHYNKGKFFNASAEKSSLENEQMSVGIEILPADSDRTARVGTTHGVLVRQIAGLIARRIVTYSKLGERVKQGDRMGIIRFGSRVDLFLPVNSTIRAKLGDVTTAGETVLGELPH
ncbi:MAG TPA: phosphatidylserine decarboxylase family protein [Gemmatimonadaceae bacterium]|nr:phosphatidylserine decarboxylase family protein [Gemmatimonadaceae bacterium]